VACNKFTGQTDVRRQLAFPAAPSGLARIGFAHIETTAAAHVKAAAATAACSEATKPANRGAASSPTAKGHGVIIICRGEASAAAEPALGPAKRGLLLRSSKSAAPLLHAATKRHILAGTIGTAERVRRWLATALGSKRIGLSRASVAEHVVVAVAVAVAVSPARSERRSGLVASKQSAAGVVGSRVAPKPKAASRRARSG